MQPRCHAFLGPVVSMNECNNKSILDNNIEINDTLHNEFYMYKFTHRCLVCILYFHFFTFKGIGLNWNNHKKLEVEYYFPPVKQLKV